ncbi:MAG: c-type cytochrome [Saprospiraceae bacterium]|nr:c-type cytochrome [Saprospiraceae bacterium]
MKSKFTILSALFIILAGFRLSDSLFVTPPHFPKPNYDFSKNPLTKSKIQLGRALFYDPILSRNNTISCSSCHSQYSAFTHTDHDLSHGIDDRIGFRNSPSLMNLAWKSSFMWDGAVHHLDLQSLAPISNPLEMDEKIENVVSKLQTSNIYPNLFYEAFGDSIITGENTLKAISQFMLTLVSANSKYDSVMLKLSSFTLQENIGYNLFKKNCASCHKEPLFTNDEFKNNGLPLDTTLNDLGRYKVSQNPLDSLKFKVPTLRNIEFSFPYMHDGRFKNLKQVLNHYTKGIASNNRISDELKAPIILSSNEKVDMIAFLLTLSDKQFLFNPQHSYPKEILLGTVKN